MESSAALAQAADLLSASCHVIATAEGESPLKDVFAALMEASEVQEELEADAGGAAAAGVDDDTGALSANQSVRRV